MPRRRRAAPLVLAAVALLAVPALAFAHAELKTATPGPDATVTVAPTELIATFTEALDGSKSSIEVRDAAGAVVASGGGDILAPDRITMTLPLPALTNGTYQVRWTSAALDGHIERGTYEFTVAEPASPSPSPSPAASVPESPSAEPSATATSSPNPSPTGGNTGGGATGGEDVTTLLPIAAALVVVAVLAIYFVRSRRG